MRLTDANSCSRGDVFRVLRIEPGGWVKPGPSAAHASPASVALVVSRCMSLAAASIYSFIATQGAVNSFTVLAHVRTK